MMVSVDVGYGYTKGVYNGEVVFHQPSIAGPERELFGDTVRKDDIAVKVNHETLFIGNLAERQSYIKYSSMNEDRNSIDITKSLVMGVIGATRERNTHEVTLITGLPFSYYFKQKGEFLNLLKSLPKEFTVYVGGEERSIAFQEVRPIVVLQSLGSYMNFLLDESGNVLEGKKRMMNQAVCVINLGFYTLEVLTMNGMEIDHSRSYSSNILGSQMAYKMVQQSLLKKEGHLFSFSEINEIIRTGIGPYEEVLSAFRILGSQVKNEFQSTNQRYGLVILSGGNAKLIQPSFVGIPTYVSETPALDTVHGYAKIGERVACQERVGS